MSNKSIPRPEHPRPTFYRPSWKNLNGEWEFFIDATGSASERKLYEAEKFDGKITVPFCPESKLSGVENTDFMPSVWYARNVDISASDLRGNVILHLGASDYVTHIHVNDVIFPRHIGGYTPIDLDITDALRVGNNRIIVHAEDGTRTESIPRGKQCKLYYSHGCDYTRTTGIWQTVWLEFVPKTYLKNVKITATDLNGSVQFETTLNRYAKDAKLKIEASIDGAVAASETFDLCGTVTNQNLQMDTVKLWFLEEPNLYDVTLTLILGGKEIDTVQSYFGIRRIDIDGYKVRINGKSVFQRLILDQGFYPDGIYTAPTDEDFVRDIKLSMKCGFNGARLHQKVFEERFLYHADRLGYIVWGEFPSWGLPISDPIALHTILPQWLETVKRDYNHPCIIGWCPYNETWDFYENGQGGRQFDSNISTVAAATKAIDPTRPVIDTSGNYHTDITDIYDVHQYGPPDYVREVCEKHAKGDFHETYPERQHYDGKMPYMFSEIGGVKWSSPQSAKHDPNGITAETEVAWGYGDAPKTIDEFLCRVRGVAEPILDTPNVFGFCYTQLTDIEQEQNGMYNYDRSPKFDEKVYSEIAKSIRKKAAIEN